MRLYAYANMRDGLVHVHKAGCADTDKAVYKRAEIIDHGDTDWATATEFGLDYWSDINWENPDDDPYVFEDLKFYPCTKELPEG